MRFVTFVGMSMLIPGQLIITRLTLDLFLSVQRQFTDEYFLTNCNGYVDHRLYISACVNIEIQKRA